MFEWTLFTCCVWYCHFLLRIYYFNNLTSRLFLFLIIDTNMEWHLTYEDLYQGEYKLPKIQSQGICELVESGKCTGNQLHLSTCPSKLT